MLNEEKKEEVKKENKSDEKSFKPQNNTKNNDFQNHSIKEEKKDTSEDKEQKARDDNFTVYIANLSRNVKEEEVREKFNQFGKIKSITVVKDHQTNEPRGFAFITYETKKESELAIKEMNDKEMEGRILKVEAAKRKGPREPRKGHFN